MLYTGPPGEAGEDLVQSVNIAAAALPEDQSRIIHSVTQQEGSQVFDAQAELPQNSWLARARSNLQVMYRTALAVSHTLDIDQLLNRIMELIFEWIEADRGCIMLLDPVQQAAGAQGPPHAQGAAPRRADHHQQDDPRLRDRAERGRAHQRRPRRTTAGTRRPASCRWASARRSACPCKAATTWWGPSTSTPRRPPQQVIQHGAVEQVHRRPPQADDRHRPPGGPGRRGHPLLFRHGPGRAAGRHRADHRHALAPHQEHPPGHPRRQLPHRDGPLRPRRNRGRQGLEDRREEPEQDLRPGHGHAHLQQGARAGAEPRPTSTTWSAT